MSKGHNSYWEKNLLEFFDYVPPPTTEENRIMPMEKHGMISPQDTPPEHTEKAAAEISADERDRRLEEHPLKRMADAAARSGSARRHLPKK